MSQTAVDPRGIILITTTSPGRKGAIFRYKRSRFGLCPGVRIVHGDVTFSCNRLALQNKVFGVYVELEDLNGQVSSVFLPTPLPWGFVLWALSAALGHGLTLEGSL